MKIETLYHWSPTARRDSITSKGLQLFQPSLSMVEKLDTGEHIHLGWHYICLAPEPSQAWRLSGDMDWGTEEEFWDLWEVTLSENDEVHFRSEFGNQIKEIRVHNPIPADRLWLVATREIPSAKEIPST